MHRVSVLGGGSFGTALANIVADNHHHARLWLRDEQRAEEINKQHRNSKYLPDYLLNPNLKACTNLSEAVVDSDVVFMAVPSSSCRDVAKVLSPLIEQGTVLISTTKGIEPLGFSLMSEVLKEEIPQARIAVLSGPNLAKEIAAKQITATVVASADDNLNLMIQKLLHCDYFRVYAGNDMYGVELGGALKNIYAIMAGIGASMGMGQNTMGMLMTRSLAEMSRFAVRKGANPMTFLGLAGVGDLIVTCSSPLSRNYRVGYELGSGRNLDDIVADLGQVAEGVNTLRLVKSEAEKMDIYMPLVSGLYSVIYQGSSVKEAIGKMMWAAQSRDVEFESQ